MPESKSTELEDSHHRALCKVLPGGHESLGRALPVRCDPPAVCDHDQNLAAEVVLERLRIPRLRKLIDPGKRLRIDPEQDPALLFRCFA